MSDSPAAHGSMESDPIQSGPIRSGPIQSGPMESSHLARSDAAALADLQLHWGEAYTLGLDGDIWSATFRGSADELRAHDCFELRELIRVDYSYRQHAGIAQRHGAAEQGPEPDAPPAQLEDAEPAPIRGERMSL